MKIIDSALKSVRLAFGKTFLAGSSREHSVLLFISGVLGVLCGLLAVAFEELIHWTKFIFMEGPALLTGAAPSVWLSILIVLTPAVGGLIVGLLTCWMKMEGDSAAAAEVMKWTAVDNGQVKRKIIWFRALTTAIFLGSGGSGGREGPITQICASMASTIGQTLKVSGDRLRLLVGCGAAAGIAAAFNAPIAGVIFSVELILADFNVVSFLPIVISSVMATTTKRMLMGDIPVFEAPSYSLASPLEIVLFFILGIICGLVAWFFYVSYFTADTLFKEHVNVHPAIKPAIGGLVVGGIGLFYPQIFGSGYSVINEMLEGDMLMGMAMTLLLLKIVATSFSLGSGGAGGIFAPALFIGCMAGGVFGYLVNGMFPDSVASEGVYAMVGLGAVMAAVAHAPLTNILMAYELTGNYQIILPIMTACIMSTYVMTLFSEESLYTEKLRRKGIKLWRGRDLTVMDRIKVGEIMTKDVTTIQENISFGDVMRLIVSSRHNYFPVLNEDNKLTGIISMQNVREVLLESAELADIVVAGEIATENVVTVRAGNNLNDAMESFSMIDIDQLPVVSQTDPFKVIGMISRMDVMAVYKKEVLKKSARATT